MAAERWERRRAGARRLVRALARAWRRVMAGALRAVEQIGKRLIEIRRRRRRAGVPLFHQGDASAGAHRAHVHVSRAAPLFDPTVPPAAAVERALRRHQQQMRDTGR